MSGTALDHRLVRDYLRELDAALRGLPAAQAAELREQITAHLDEALAPDASNQEVASTLRRLGSPADLATEAAPATPASASATTAAAGPGAARAHPTGPTVSAVLGARLARVRLRTWIAAGMVVALMAAGALYANVFLSAGSLQTGYDADWWYRQDARHEDIATAGDTVQNTAPIRDGQRQGYLITVYNPTSVTQTIVGDGSGPHIGWNNPGGHHEQIAVSRSYTDIANGVAGQNVAGHLQFGLPVSIPPLATRLVRVTWISDQCLTKGESQGIDQIYLRVRVGWFTRTETLSQQAWYLIGATHRNCG